ncbi:MAG: hypothetical protein WCT32_01005 [Patescibacteria group bacterium]|jgi:1,4-dihydroxy-2-naphthoate octaprenyltransferase
MTKENKTFRHIKIALVTALGAMAEIYAVSFLLSGPLEWDFLFIMFLIPTAVYLFNYFEEPRRWEAKDVYESTLHKHIIFTLFILCFTVGTLWFVGVHGNSIGLSIAILIMVWGLLYTVLFKGLTHYILGFKDFYVAVGWNLIIPFYVFYYSLPFNYAVIIIMVLVFIRDLMNTSYYDLKDMDEDKEKGLKTFATVLGGDRLFLVLQLLNGLGAFIIIVAVLLRFMPLASVLILVPILASSCELFWSRANKSYSSLLIDLEYFIWALVFFIYQINGKN